MKHNNYLKLLMAIAIIASLSMVPAIALAHEVSSDGSISVTMHMEPNNTPMAGMPETLEFFIVDSSSRFDLADCTYTITGNGSVSQATLVTSVNRLLGTSAIIIRHDGQ